MMAYLQSLSAFQLVLSIGFERFYLSMEALQCSGSGIANKRILLEHYLSSSTRRAHSLIKVGVDIRPLQGLKLPIAAKTKPFVSRCLKGSRARVPGYEDITVLKYVDDHSQKNVDEAINSYSALEQNDGVVGTNVRLPQEDAIEQRRYAKIHDFCLGIPYGGFLFGGGLFGFLFSRSNVSLTTSMLGVAILALAAISLKVWRKGLSSLPFMLGQAALAATLIVKHFRSYSLTKKLFPSGLYMFMSVAMLCFYSYVVFSGGNPPPKKKLAAASPS